jgi:hypothetical protein
MFIPPRIVITRKCPRCQLRYPKKYSQCSHCTGLNDNEVEALKLRYKNEHRGNANLGRLFVYFAALLAIGMVIYNWN